MYRQGLGDCFLVTLPKDDGSPFYLMIDCGVILGTSKPEEEMTKVVSNIIKVTGGHVDLLVVTHEHWDHVSGFIQAQPLFSKATDDKDPNKLSVGEVWFAWTENPSDALANRLRRERAERVKKLVGFVRGMSALGVAGKYSTTDEIVERVDELLSFSGVSGKSKKSDKTTGAAMAFAAQLSNKIRYCLPTDKPSELASVKGVRIYVLGPPHNEDFLRKTDSSKEVYHLTGQGAASSFFAAATAKLPEMMADNVEQETQFEIDRHYPFDKTYRHSLKSFEVPQSQTAEPLDALTEFFDRYYFGRSSDPIAPDQSWRRIDASWLGAAAEFALQLDSLTNNTSLALAIELIDSGKVLLFAADAQVGNWLSWQDLTWKLNAETTVTGPDLLRRTVFYKVGHHGSHNATLETKGLELMRTDDFVAFIPVNHKMAVKKRWGQMPLPNLVKELNVRSKGRVVRIDEDYKIPSNDDGTAAAFAKNLTVDELFHEWRMPID
jgi:hypothetical protein